VVRRGIRLAEEQGADVIILDIATPGGRVDAALAIGDLLRDTTVPVVAYVSGRAWSAGAYIALSADEIAMVPGSSIGAAETNPDTAKVISAWRGEMESAAERNGRTPMIAGAMVDKELEIEGLVGRGEILTLTASRALEVGYAEYSVSSLDDLLNQLDLAGATVSQVEATWVERVARTVTSPSIAPIFLVIGFVGLTMEFFLPGWGVAGFVGIASLALFFGGHMLAGLAGWEALISFMVGVLLLFIEAFVTPGFGVAGIAGIVLVFAGIYFTSGDAVQAIRTIMLSFFGAVAVTGVMLRYFKDSTVWNRIILKDSLNRESGYISTNEPVDLIGKRGRTVTMLRPAGIAEIEGVRVDVVSEGGFLPAGQTVQVVKVEGSRIIVQLVTDD
jgi:membrane-bound serine protease (ClpP class)